MCLQSCFFISVRDFFDLIGRDHIPRQDSDKTSSLVTANNISLISNLPHVSPGTSEALVLRKFRIRTPSRSVPILLTKVEARREKIEWALSTILPLSRHGSARLLLQRSWCHFGVKLRHLCWYCRLWRPIRPYLSIIALLDTSWHGRGRKVVGIQNAEIYGSVA